MIPSLGAGGMERVMAELVNFFTEETKHEIHLIILSNKNHFYTINGNVKIYNPPFTVRGTIGSVKLLLFLRKTISEIQPHSILSFGEMYNSFVILSTLGLKKSVFVSDRSKPDKDWGILHNNLRNSLYKYSTGIIAQTEIAKEITLERIAHSNVKVIGNPFQMKSNYPNNSRKDIILTVGRMIKSKQHQQLIKIFSALPDNNWELHFVGDGPERENIKKEAIESSVASKIVFHGSQSSVEQYYNTAKIFAFTSNSEGFPNVVGEAMCHGVVPICYNFIAGATDLIQNEENGLIIELDDQKTFATRLYRLMNDEKTLNKLRSNSFESMQKFNIKAIGYDYLNFILNK